MLRYIVIFFFLCYGALHTHACDPPSLVSVDSIKRTTVFIDWYGFDDDIDTYEIDLVEGTGNPSSVPMYSGITDTKYLLQNLSSGTQYTAYIRSVCNTEKSEWASIKFRTAFNAETNCFMPIPLSDNNCQYQVHNEFIFIIDSSDINNISSPILSSISLIINHPWPSDLKANLISPSGRAIPLFSDLSLGYDDIGDSSDSTCESSLVLTDNSCRFIGESTGPFVGRFKPKGVLSQVPSDSLIGKWTLDICDDSPGDRGTLQYVKLDFATAECIPVQMELNSFTSEEVAFIIQNRKTKDTIYIKYGIDPYDYMDTTGFKIDTFLFSSSADSIVSLKNLLAGETYNIYASRKCANDISQPSCKTTVSTLCNKVTALSDFDEYSPSTGNCRDSSLINGIWYQLEESGFLWKVGKGMTGTDLTGPVKSPYGNNNYVYVDASDQACGMKDAILKSSCFYVPANVSECSMFFFYSMYGEGVSSLILRIRENEGQTYDTIFVKTGNQGSGWHSAMVDLSEFSGSNISSEFIVSDNSGTRGDIALDNITFMGPLLIHRDGNVYFTDSDNDNYGVLSDSTRLCRSGQIPSFSPVPGDCDDNNNNINPEVAEIPCNLIDDNCNGSIDEVQQDTLPGFMLVDSNNPSCEGRADGFLEIEIENYTEYSLKWNTGDTTERIENLSAGVYYAEITTSTGCKFRSQFYELNNISSLNALVTEKQLPTCNGIADGSITVQVGGGFSPYVYQWNNGDTLPTIDSINIGVYSVTIEDANGCISTIDSIKLPADPSTQAQIDNYEEISCSGAKDGALIASIQGADAQSYLWNTGDTNRIINDLSAGFYSCTILFNDICSITTDSFYLNEPDVLSLSKLNIEAPACATINDGTIITRASGGTPPYNYRLFGNNTFYDGPVFQDLSATVYRLEVRDANNCNLSVDSILLAQKDSLEVTAVVNGSRCPLSRDGQIITEASGGTQPYNYIWSHTGIDTSSMHQLKPGNYFLTVVDNLGCKSGRNSYHINRGTDSLNVNVKVIDPIYCGDTTGSLSAMVSNGKVNPVNYNWDNGTVHEHSYTSDTLQQIKHGTYMLTATDANGCVGVSENITIKELDTLHYSDIDIEQLRCKGDSNGRIAFDFDYFNPPLTFTWNTTSTDSILKNLAAGSYRLTITDAAGCEVISPYILIRKDNPLGAEHFIDNIQGNKFYIEVKPTGGKPPYTIKWKDDMSTEFFRNNIEAGLYSYTLIDSLNCALDSTIRINPVSRQNAELTDLEIYPIPATDYIRIDIPEKLKVKDYKIVIKTIDGRLLKAKKNTSIIYISSLPSGIYFIELTSFSRRARAKFIKH